MPNPKSVLVIGIGNEFRQDDGAGIEAARRLRSRALPGIVVLERSGEGTGLMAAWDGAAAVVIVIDAVSSGASPGTVHRFEVTAAPSAQPDSDGPRPPSRIFRGTSHQIGLGEAIDLASALGTLPAHLVVYGIEGQAFGEGTDLSPAVALAVDEVVARIAANAPYRTCRSTASE